MRHHPFLSNGKNGALIFRAGFWPALIVFAFFLLFGSSISLVAGDAQPVTLVDVMVLYTPQARDGAGGTAAIRTNIDTAFFEANSVLQNSLVNVRLRPAYVGEIAYTESGSVSIDLAHLRNPSDFFLGQASRLRDQYAADLVCLVTETGDDYDFYGLQGPSSENAFSIIRRPFLIGQNKFPVVLSFNFGCQLERGYADSAGAFTYAYGYSFSGTNDVAYSTVEAFSAERLPFFSNPNIVYQGVPAGIPKGSWAPADNARVLNQTAPLVAAFRSPAPVTQPPTLRIGSPLSDANLPRTIKTGASLLLLASASDQDGSIRQVNFYRKDVLGGTVQFLGSATNLPYKLNCTNLSAGDWTIAAQAMDNRGATTREDSAVVFHVVPSNDDFTNAIALSGTNISITGTTRNSTLETNETNWLSSEGSVWYTWTAPANGRVTINCSGADLFALCTGDNASNATSIADNLSVPQIDVPVISGVTYHVLVVGAGDTNGLFNLNLTFESAPPNDNFENPAVLDNGGAIAVANNTAASAQPGEYNLFDNGPASRSLWWIWIAPSNGTVSFTANCDFQPIIAVYRGDSLSNAAPLTSGVLGYTGTVDVNAGESYHVSIDGLGGAYGNFQLSAVFNPGPANDNFTNRAVITENAITLTGSLSEARPYPSGPVLSSGSYRALWWSWTAPANGYLTLNDFNGPPVSLFTGIDISNLNAVQPKSPGAFDVIGGTTYVIAVSGNISDYDYVALQLSFSTIRIVSPTNGAVLLGNTSIQLAVETTTNDLPFNRVDYFANGVFIGSARNPPYSLIWSNSLAQAATLTAVASGPQNHRSSPPVMVQILPPNDNFANRTVIQGAWVGITNSTYAATLEPGEPNLIPGNAIPSIWWSWTAPSSGIVTIADSTLSHSYDNAIAVFTGSSISNLTRVTNGWDQVNFQATAGTTYAIAAGSSDDYINLELILSGVRITSPTNGTIFRSTTTIDPEIEFTSAEQPIYQIQYFMDGIEYGAVFDPSSSIGFVNVKPGEHTVVVAVVDTSGHTHYSPPVVVEMTPKNDRFADRTVIQGNFIKLTDSVLEASLQPGEPSIIGGGFDDSIWWSWTAPYSGRVTLSSTTYDASFGVFTGNSFSNLVKVADGYSPLDFQAIAGTTYAICGQAEEGDFDLQLALSTVHITSPTNGSVFTQGDNIPVSVSSTSNDGPVTNLTVFANDQPVASNNNAASPLVWSNAPAGDYTLIASVTDIYKGIHSSEPVHIRIRPPNDDFVQATVLVGSNVLANGTFLGSGFEPGEPVPVYVPFPSSGYVASVWYSWAAPASGKTLLSLNADMYADMLDLEVYTGSHLTNLSLIAGTGGAGLPSPSVTINAQAGVTYSLGVFSLGDWIDQFSISIVQRPPNDNFTNATVLSGMHPFANGDNSSATGEPGEPGNASHHSVWYSWTSPSSGVLTITASGTDSIPALTVYKGGTISNLIPINGNNPDGTTFNVTGGVNYKIAVDGSGGPFSLSLSLASVPANDNFAARTRIDGMNISVQGSTYLATAEQGETSLPTYENRSVWYSWTAPANGIVEGYCSKVAGVFTGNTLSNLTAIVPVAFGNFSFAAVGGVEYQIAVDGEAWSGSDDFTLLIVLPKAQFVTPTNGTVLPSPGDFNIVARTIDLEGAVVSVGFYDGTNCLAVVSNAPFQFHYTNAPAGARNLSLLATDANGITTTNVPIEVRIQPFNDNFAQRYTISGTQTNFTANNSGATHESGEYLPGGATGRTLWWTWQAPADGTVTISADGLSEPPEILYPPLDITTIGFGSPPPEYGPLIAIYTNSALSNLSLCASNTGWYDYFFDPEGPFGYWYPIIPFNFTVTAGQIYQISFDGLNGSFGPSSITFQFSPPPSNDNFAGRTTIPGNQITIFGTTASATVEPGDPLGETILDTRTVWYSWKAPQDGFTSVSAVGYDMGFPFTPDVAVYSGSTLSNLNFIYGRPGGFFGFYAFAGTVYQIEIGDHGDEGTNFYFSLAGPPPDAAPNPAASSVLPDGRFRLAVSGVVGESFIVQASTNLVDWQTIAQDTMQGNEFDLIDGTVGTFLPRRFYRVVRLEDLFP